MKIALCLSGQPRNLDECYPFFYESLLRGNDVDVFAHVWWDEECKGKTYMWHSSAKFGDEDLAKKFIECYKPVAYTVEKQRQFDLSFCEKHNYEWLDDVPQKQLDIFTPGVIFCMMSQTYSILQADLLRQNYTDDYDIVIRARTDLLFDRVQDFETMFGYLKNSPDTIIWQSSMDGGAKYCGEFPGNPCDWFCVGLPDTMTKTTHTWHHAIKEHYKEGALHINDYVRRLCVDAGVNIALGDFGASVVRKENGHPLEFREIEKYWDDFDSEKGEVSKNKDEWPFWVAGIDFKRLSKEKKED